MNKLLPLTVALLLLASMTAFAGGSQEEPATKPAVEPEAMASEREKVGHCEIMHSISDGG